MKAIKSELEAQLPIVPTRIVFDFVQEFMGVKKPDNFKVKNPIGVRQKRREKQKRIKSGREISMKKSNKKRMSMVFVDLLLTIGELVEGKNTVMVLISCISCFLGGNDHV
ncbi:hypothetical protein Tco_1203076 [Tanacetum coccineum]